jgi:hypothetical protein
MTRLGMSVVSAALCAVMSFGCGRSVDLNNLHDEDLDALCDQLLRCGEVSSHDTCVALLDRVLSTARIEAGAKAGAIKYDADKAGECLDAIADQSCDPASKNARIQPQACTDAIKGTRKQGESCFFGGECETKSCTLPGTCTMACCAGTCDPPPPPDAAIGQPCEAAPCVEGAYCNAAGTCAALIAEGQACEFDDECAYDTSCIGATGAKTCKRSPKIGDPCLDDGGALTCIVGGTGCDATMHCVARLDAGATCDPQRSLCKGDLICDATSNKCSAAPGTGQPCTIGCAAGNYCELGTTGSGTCQKLKADGQACMRGGECDSNNCDATSKTCTVPQVCA